MDKSNSPTGGKSKSSSKKKPKKLAIDRPFDPAILKRAREIAETYQYIVHFEDGDFYARALEVSGAMNHGATREEAIENGIDITTSLLAYMLEKGEIPPPPASDERRDEQVNVRLTRLEKVLLEEAARVRGYRGISDFMRAATLASTR
jgi:predicted RNase H-like HicB family nuclease